MRYKLLGRSGLRVSALCLGTMTFDGTGGGWCVSEKEGRGIVDAFLDAGGNFLDTHTYGPTEDYLGGYLTGRRDRVVLSTKFGGTLAADDVNASGAHRKSLVRSVESSLRRLRTDYLDLLWLHAWDPLTPTEELMRATDDLVRRGKVLYLGVANAPAWAVAHAVTLADQRGWTPFVAVQVEYSLVERDVDREILPMAHSLGLGVTAWTPLASGWLTGKYLSGGDTAGSNGSGGRRLDDPVMSRFLPRNDRTVEIGREVCRIAEENECPPAHVALNWLRRRGAIPLFGATSPEQVRQNAACFDSLLSAEQADRLDAVSRIRLGFPHDFLNSGLVRRLMYGEHAGLVDVVSR
ncbi:aldo/keto reductase [Mangrovihabitans endophyticus]|uniref:Oxidoreductase n=1 Tax=Mangrovihabitans endophyticus TaxID=1751298 RepID=A0A8J3BUW8_9ACTN|nr:aldo/keto reductase [Mangrovihabitans endophyticus]GGK76591.1 oxidoreductase [Mangrovihabitans endophyticus]